MTIQSILAGKGSAVATVTRDTVIADVVALLRERRIGAVLVMEGGRMAGVLSERDVVRCLATDVAGGGVGDGTPLLERPAHTVMTSPVVTCAAGDSLLAALALMTDRRVRHLPVVDGAGTVVGIVSIGDLVKARLDRLEHEADQLKAYISGA